MRGKHGKRLQTNWDETRFLNIMGTAAMMSNIKI